MNAIDFIKSFICLYCKTPIVLREELYNISDYECRCSQASYTHYTTNNEFFLYFNLTKLFQLQIFVNENSTIFQLAEYPGYDQEVNLHTVYHLKLDFIPENLNLQDADKLLEQLELLIIFQ